MVVIHYTAMTSTAAALKALCDPRREVSAHYLIAEDGEVLSLVPEALRAWHAGAGRWGAVTDVNSRSIGIELANDGFSPFAARQMDALVALLRGILARWNIPPERIIGHSDMAPTRKIDPGTRFDWQRLSRQGLAVWPNVPRCTGPGDMTTFAHAAARFGYDPDLSPEQMFHAFALRFRPPGNVPSAMADAMIADLADRYPVDANPTWV